MNTLEENKEVNYDITHRHTLFSELEAKYDHKKLLPFIASRNKVPSVA